MEQALACVREVECITERIFEETSETGGFTKSRPIEYTHYTGTYEGGGSPSFEPLPCSGSNDSSSLMSGSYYRPIRSIEVRELYSVEVNSGEQSRTYAVNSAGVR